MKSRILTLAIVVLAVPVLADAPLLPLTTTRGMHSAQICPVGPNEGFTARHVAYERYEDDLDMNSIPMRWSMFGTWKGGVAQPANFSHALDIARVTSDTPFPYFFPIAAVDPKVGDRVTIVGYNFDKGAKPYIVKTKITDFSAGVLYTEDTPGPGSSGSCVFNEEGEVVAINYGARVVSMDRVRGAAVVLTPDVIEGLRAE